MTMTKIGIVGIALLLLLGIPLISVQIMSDSNIVELDQTNETKGKESYLLSHQFNNVSGSSVGFSLNLTNATHYRLIYALNTETAGFELDGEWMNGTGRTDWISCESIDYLEYIVTGGDEHPESIYADYFIVEVIR